MAFDDDIGFGSLLDHFDHHAEHMLFSRKKRIKDEPNTVGDDEHAASATLTQRAGESGGNCLARFAIDGHWKASI